MNSLKRLKLDIAASIFVLPCIGREELNQREFLKTISLYGISRLIHQLEKDGAIYYRGDKMFIYKEWAKKNLGEYELF